jgi:hypothetical protein
VLAAALAGGAAGLAAIEFGQHAFQVAALGQIMGVTAMAAERQIVAPEMRGNADRRRLLADRQMGRAAHLLFGVEVADALLDQADAQDLPVEIETGVVGHQARIT